MYEDVTGGQLTQEQIDAYLDQPLLARLASASAATLQPHVVPVWYLWDGTAIWVHGFRGSRKFRELRSNPRCSIVVDHAVSGVDFWAVLFEGQVEFVDTPDVVHETATRIYTRYIGADGVHDPVPQSWIHDADSVLLKLTPARTVSWYSARQTPPLAPPPPGDGRGR